MSALPVARTPGNEQTETFEKALRWQTGEEFAGAEVNKKNML